MSYALSSIQYRIKHALRYSAARVVNVQTEADNGGLSRKRMRNSDSVWMFDAEDNNKRLRVQAAIDAIGQYNDRDEARNELKKREQTQALKYAVTLWKIKNAHRLVNETIQTHDCIKSKCKHAALRVEIWASRPTDEMQHLHRCIQTLKYDPDDRYLCHYDNLYESRISGSDWVNKHRIHVCVTVIADGRETCWCEFRKDPVAHHGHSPRSVVENLYMCETSGTMHFCNTERCVHTFVDQNTPVCPISGLAQNPILVDKFYRPNGQNQDGESSKYYNSMRRRSVSMEKWTRDLLDKSTFVDIRKHLNRLRAKLVSHLPQMYYKAVAQTLIRLLDCPEFVSAKETIRARVVTNLSNKAKQQVFVRYGKEHKGMVSLSDLAKEIFAMHQRIFVPLMITNGDSQMQYYETLSDGIVRLWYLAKMYGDELHRFNGNRNQVSDFVSFVFPALIAIRTGIKVRHGDLIHVLVPRDKLWLTLIPPDEELERYYPRGGELYQRHQGIHRVLQDTISYLNKNPDHLCLANLILDELDTTMFPCNFSVMNYIEHVEQIVRIELNKSL